MNPGVLAGVAGQDAGTQAPSLHPCLGPFSCLCSWPGGTLWVAQPRPGSVSGRTPPSPRALALCVPVLGLHLGRVKSTMGI